MRQTHHRFALGLAGLLCSLCAVAAPPDGGQVLTADEAADNVSDALDRRLVDEVSRNLASLKQRGISPAGSLQSVGGPRPPGAPKAVSGMTWPLGPVNGAGTAWHGISNFVDLNPAFPGQITDYTCAARSCCCSSL